MHQPRVNPWCAGRTPGSVLVGRGAPTPRGFTLLELVIALAVLAVLGTLSLPSMHSRVLRARLHSAAEALAADLAQARFEAARRGQALHLEAATGPAWCWAVAATAGCACAQPQPCQLKVVRAQDYPGVHLLQASPARLDPRGVADGSLGATFEGGRNERLRVHLLPLGRVRICTAQGDALRYARC